MSALRDGAPQLLQLPTSTGYGLGLMNAPWQSLVATVLLGAGGVLAVSSLPARTPTADKAGTAARAAA